MRDNECVKKEGGNQLNWRGVEWKEVGLMASVPTPSQISKDHQIEAGV